MVFFNRFAGICDCRCGGCGVVEIGGAVVAMALWWLWRCDRHGGFLFLFLFLFFFFVSPIWVDMDDGGGGWKKVKSKVMENSGRDTCGGEN